MHCGIPLELPQCIAKRKIGKNATDLYQISSLSSVSWPYEIKICHFIKKQNYDTADINCFTVYKIRTNIEFNEIYNKLLKQLKQIFFFWPCARSYVCLCLRACVSYPAKSIKWYNENKENSDCNGGIFVFAIMYFILQNGRLHRLGLWNKWCINWSLLWSLFWNQGP